MGLFTTLFAKRDIRERNSGAEDSDARQRGRTRRDVLRSLAGGIVASISTVFVSRMGYAHLAPCSTYPPCSDPMFANACFHPGWSCSLDVAPYFYPLNHAWTTPVQPGECCDHTAMHPIGYCYSPQSYC